MTEFREGMPWSKLGLTRVSIFSIALFIVALATTATAQQIKKIPRIVYVSVGAIPTGSLGLDAFRQGLRELGYIDGKTITFEFRNAQGDLLRLPAVAAEVVRSSPDVIVVQGTVNAQVLKEATNLIPIVVLSAGDLVGRGIVSSLARPGGNVTGLTAIAPDVSAKRLEFLRELLPRAARVAVFFQHYEEDELKETEAAARVLSIHVARVPLEDKSQIAGAFATMKKAQTDALMIFNNSITSANRTELLQLALTHRLPTVCESRAFVDQGCLISYAPNRVDLARRGAGYVDKILRGRKPADLPVEQPTSFELVVNLKTAKQLGLPIPMHILARADHTVQ